MTIQLASSTTAYVACHFHRIHLESTTEFGVRSIRDGMVELVDRAAHFDREYVPRRENWN
jgi:hypothetical protein